MYGKIIDSFTDSFMLDPEQPIETQEHYVYLSNRMLEKSITDITSFIICENIPLEITDHHNKIAEIYYNPNADCLDFVGSYEKTSQLIARDLIFLNYPQVIHDEKSIVFYLEKDGKRINALEIHYDHKQKKFIYIKHYKISPTFQTFLDYFMREINIDNFKTYKV